MWDMCGCVSNVVGRRVPFWGQAQVEESCPLRSRELGWNSDGTGLCAPAMELQPNCLVPSQSTAAPRPSSRVAVLGITHTQLPPPICWAEWRPLPCCQVQGESRSTIPLPPSQSRHRKVQLLQTPHPISFPASALLAGSGNLEGLQWRIWQADLSQFFPVQTNVVNWFTKHFRLFTVLSPFFE